MITAIPASLSRKRSFAGLRRQDRVPTDQRPVKLLDVGCLVVHDKNFVSRLCPFRPCSHRRSVTEISWRLKPE